MTKETIDEIIKRRIAGLNKSKLPDTPSEASESDISEGEANEGDGEGKVPSRAIKDKRKRLRGYINKNGRRKGGS